MPSRKWIFRAHDRAQVESLVSTCEISPVVAQLLLNREITCPQEVSRFLQAKLTDLRPPELLPGMTAAVDRIMRAVADGEQIVVYGDYDADGMTATAILYRCLTLLRANVIYHLPNRLDEGYGLHVESVEKLASRGKQLIITVDCGIASLEAAQRAKQLGVSLVITDHHQYGTQLPEADALVHPGLPGSEYPFSGLCGAGVAFKLAWALCQAHCGSSKVNERLRDFLVQAVGLAAIGTVADVVPLLDENRLIVRNGLRSLARSSPLGLRKLMAKAGMLEKQQLDADDFGFSIAPRLNAAGRLGQAQLAVELLVTEDAERATALVDYLEELNNSRNKLERSIHLAATKQIKEVHLETEDPAFVLASPAWHPGVIGIVAGKLAEKHHKPVVLIALDKLGVKPGTGSARSPNGINLHSTLEQCSDLLVTSGGHAAAAGLKIEESQLSAFRSAFLEAVAEQAEEAESEACVNIDAEATLADLDMNSVTQIEQLAPFGMGNHRPLFCALGVQLAQAPKVIGASGKTLSLQLSQFGKKMRAVAFGQAEEWLPKMESLEAEIDIVFRPVINDFRGFRKVEIQLTDWRVHDPVAKSPNATPKPHLQRPTPAHFTGE